MIVVFKKTGKKYERRISKELLKKGFRITYLSNPGIWNALSTTLIIGVEADRINEAILTVNQTHSKDRSSNSQENHKNSIELYIVKNHEFHLF